VRSHRPYVGLALLSVVLWIAVTVLCLEGDRAGVAVVAVTGIIETAIGLGLWWQSMRRARGVKDGEVKASEALEPAIPAAAQPSMDESGLDGPTVAFACRDTHVPGRIYASIPSPGSRTTLAMEMVPVCDIARDFASLYAVAHSQGFDEGVGAAARFSLPSDEAPTNGHSRPRAE
jgi:hypothetical protein